MFGFLVWYSNRWVCSSAKAKGEQYQLLITQGYQKDGKHSFIKRPSDKIAYGDKEVVHRKMNWFVKPIFVSDLLYPDWDYSQDIEWSDGGYWHLTESGHSAVDGVARYSCQLIAPYIYYPWQRFECYEAELGIRDGTLPGQHEIFRRWRKWGGEGSEPTPAPSSAQWNDRVIGYYFDPKYVHIEECGNGGWDSSFEFDEDPTLPSNWMAYMDSIRPWTDNDDAALSEVIRNTIQEDTTLDTNNIANVKQFIDLVKDFRNGKVSKLIKDTKNYFGLVQKTFSKKSYKRLLNCYDPNTMKTYKRFFAYTGRNARTLCKKTEKGIASGWLKYRYAYNTTKSDVYQFIRATANNLFETDNEERVYRGNIGISNGRLHVKFRMHEPAGAFTDKLLIEMDKRGFFPGLYNVWDMVPFSFVVDWFFPVGDYLQDLDQSIYFRYYKVDELCVSYKQTLFQEEHWGPTTYRWYDRVLLDDWPEWEFYSESGTSNKVKTFRAIDAGALVIGVT